MAITNRPLCDYICRIGLSYGRCGFTDIQMVLVMCRFCTLREEEASFIASLISPPQIYVDQWKAYQWIWSSVRHSTRTQTRWCHQCPILSAHGLCRHCPFPGWQCLHLPCALDGDVTWRIAWLQPAFSATPPDESACKSTCEESLPRRKNKKRDIGKLLLHKSRPENFKNVSLQ